MRVVSERRLWCGAWNVCELMDYRSDKGRFYHQDVMRLRIVKVKVNIWLFMKIKVELLLFTDVLC